MSEAESNNHVRCTVSTLGKLENLTIPLLSELRRNNHESCLHGNRSIDCTRNLSLRSLCIVKRHCKSCLSVSDLICENTTSNIYRHGRYHLSTPTQMTQNGFGKRLLEVPVFEREARVKFSYYSSVCIRALSFERDFLMNERRERYSCDLSNMTDI